MVWLLDRLFLPVKISGMPARNFDPVFLKLLHVRNNTLHFPYHTAQADAEDKKKREDQQSAHEGVHHHGVQLHERFVLFSRIKRAMQKKHGEKEDLC